MKLNVGNNEAIGNAETARMEVYRAPSIHKVISLISYKFAFHRSRGPGTGIDNTTCCLGWHFVSLVPRTDVRSSRAPSHKEIRIKRAAPHCLSPKSGRRLELDPTVSPVAFRATSL
jgi:hypothetical protein